MKKDRNNKKIYIELVSDYQLNLLHGILVEEEKKANQILEILSSKDDNYFTNTKKALKEVKRLRRLLTVMGLIVIQIEELKGLDQAVDDIIKKIDKMSVEELEEQKTIWEERICNDEIDSPCQRPRLKILRKIIDVLYNRS